MLAGIAGGLQTAGWRSRLFWCLAVVSLVIMLAYWRAVATGRVIVGLQTVWSLAPFISVYLALIAASGREPRKPPLKETPIAKVRPVFNPALTAEYLQSLVSGATDLEAKHKIQALGYQVARLKGKIIQITPRSDHILVSMIGVFDGQGDQPYNKLEMEFKTNQTNVLSVVKQGDFIEFEGVVSYCSFRNWKLVDCDYIGRFDPRRYVNAP